MQMSQFRVRRDKGKTKRVQKRDGKILQGDL
jgi:hypothetical protein